MAFIHECSVITEAAGPVLVVGHQSVYTKLPNTLDRNRPFLEIRNSISMLPPNTLDRNRPFLEVCNSLSILLDPSRSLSIPQQVDKGMRPISAKNQGSGSNIRDGFAVWRCWGPPRRSTVKPHKATARWPQAQQPIGFQTQGPQHGLCKAGPWRS